MTDVLQQNRPFYWSTHFLRALCQHGLTHVVISPGSRSTPLTLAAAALPQLQKHIVLDERSAAFMALGISKSTDQPAALICTSGTAVANYFPAIIEACQSHTPLLLLTADRPPYLQQTGANQTINQQNIFGNYPVFFHDTGEPVINENDLNSLSRLAQQAQYHAKTEYGPVHINFPFRKPLEPHADFLKEMVKKNKQLANKSSANIFKNHLKKNQLNGDIFQKIDNAERPLIIVGQLAPAINVANIFELAEKLQSPVLSEQGITNLTYAIQGFEGFLRNKDNCFALAPDLILRFGLQPASKSLLQSIANWNPEHHIYFSHAGNWSDIDNSTTNSTDWNGNCFDCNEFTDKSTHWLEKWKDVAKRYKIKQDVALAKEGPLTDGHIYHHLVPKIPKQWSVTIANSFPARDQSMFGTWATQKIFTNRGASGIDGITSTAMGVNIGLNQPGILFTGDLAFLHDTNALLNNTKLSQPLIVVVINNQGGSIFRMLPIAKHQEYFSPYFETPQPAHISELAQSYGIDTTEIKSVSQLQKINFQHLIQESSSMISIIECKTNADISIKIRNQLWGDDED